MGTTRSLRTGPSCSYKGAVRREDLVTKANPHKVPKGSVGSILPFLARSYSLPLLATVQAEQKVRKKWRRNLSDFQDTSRRIC